MSKKSFVVILILSIVIAIIGPVIAFSLDITSISGGFPMKWSSFSFLGSSTNYMTLTFDVAFWFVVIWGIWALIKRLQRK